MGDEAQAVQAEQEVVVAQQSELIAVLEAALADAESRAAATLDGARWEAKARRLEKQLEALRKASEEAAVRYQERILAMEMQAQGQANGGGAPSDDMARQLLEVRIQLDSERVAAERARSEARERDEELKRCMAEKEAVLVAAEERRKAIEMEADRRMAQAVKEAEERAAANAREAGAEEEARVQAREAAVIAERKRLEEELRGVIEGRRVAEGEVRALQNAWNAGKEEMTRRLEEGNAAVEIEKQRINDLMDEERRIREAVEVDKERLSAALELEKRLRADAEANRDALQQQEEVHRKRGAEREALEEERRKRQDELQRISASLNEERQRNGTLMAEMASLKETLSAVRASADKSYLESLSLEEQLNAARALPVSAPAPAPLPPLPVAPPAAAPKADGPDTTEQLVTILREQVRVLQQQVRVLRNSAALDEERLQEAKSDLEAAHSEAAERAAEAARSTSVLQGALLAARRELAIAQAAHHSAVLEAHAGREALEKAAEERRAAERSAKEQSNAAAEALSVVEALRETHKSEVARMQQALADMQLQLLDQSQLEVAAKQAAEQNSQLSAQLDTDRAQLRSVNTLLEAARADVKRLEQELGTVQASLGVEQQVRSIAEARAEGAVAESAALKARLESALNAKGVAEREALQRELELIDTLEAQLRDLRLLHDPSPRSSLAPSSYSYSSSQLPIPSHNHNHHNAPLPTTATAPPSSSSASSLRIPPSQAALSRPPVAPAKRQVISALNEERRALAQARQKLVDELWSKSVSVLPSRKPREYAFLSPVATPSKH